MATSIGNDSIFSSVSTHTMLLLHLERMLLTEKSPQDAPKDKAHKSHKVHARTLRRLRRMALVPGADNEL